ncbi:glycosyltransferase family A protein [Geitlerinema splendidum]|nr:glycosyltransferase family A protein [Geitlerinema splendidum]
MSFRGEFWHCKPQLDQETLNPELAIFPSICSVVPARNEADVLPEILRSLFLQNNSNVFEML